MPMPAHRERSILGRIWEAERRLNKLNAQRDTLIAEFEVCCSNGVSGGIERAYDLAEATTRLDIQVKHAEADLALWKNELEFARKPNFLACTSPEFNPSERGV